MQDRLGRRGYQGPQGSGVPGEKEQPPSGVSRGPVVRPQQPLSFVHQFDHSSYDTLPRRLGLASGGRGCRARGQVVH